MLETPEDVLGAVATDTEVRGLERGPILRPDGLALPFPTMGDRVTEEDELGFALLRDLIEGLVTLFRAGMQDGLDGIVGTTRQEDGGSE
jgi:hypothetical protein